ncbi:hypothetical protein I6H08_37625 (plasmid) [Burkholderia gladioli]|uniref:hypothetical protein n=1 Tax=Burkholderia gladioli TaxID=28095 RepID=UPI0019352D4E|nr:hypothetical protein [Burkholderia gladioli]QPQ88806.1 hypothetical protein I6H08_37625 [Burkholderia gladioli]
MSHTIHRVRAVSANTVSLLAPHAAVQPRRRLSLPLDLGKSVARPAIEYTTPYIPTGSNIATGEMTYGRNDSMPIVVTVCGAV